jgi:hypothetical protein
MGTVHYTQTKAERQRVQLKRRLLAAVALCWGADLLNPGEGGLTRADGELLCQVQLALVQSEGTDFQLWRELAIKDGMAAVREIARELGILKPGGAE